MSLLPSGSAPPPGAASKAPADFKYVSRAALHSKDASQQQTQQKDDTVNLFAAPGGSGPRTRTRQAAAAGGGENKAGTPSAAGSTGQVGASAHPPNATTSPAVSPSIAAEEFKTPPTAPASPLLRAPATAGAGGQAAAKSVSTLTSFTQTARADQHPAIDTPASPTKPISHTTASELVLGSDSVESLLSVETDLEEVRVLRTLIGNCQKRAGALTSLASFLASVPTRRRQAVALDHYFFDLVEAIFCTCQDDKFQSLIAKQVGAIDLIRPLSGALSTSSMVGESTIRSEDLGTDETTKAAKRGGGDGDKQAAGQPGATTSQPSALGRTASAASEGSLQHVRPGASRQHLAKGSFGMRALALLENVQEVTEIADASRSFESSLTNVGATGVQSGSALLSQTLGSLLNRASGVASSFVSASRSNQQADKDDVTSRAPINRRSSIMHRPATREAERPTPSAFGVLTAALGALGLDRGGHGLGVIATFCALLMRHAYGVEVPLELQGALFKLLFEDTRQFVLRGSIGLELTPRPIRRLLTAPDVFRWQVVQPGFVLPLYAEKLPFILNSKMREYIDQAAHTIAQTYLTNQVQGGITAEQARRLPPLERIKVVVARSILSSLYNQGAPGVLHATVNALAKAKYKAAVSQDDSSPNSLGSPGEVVMMTPIEYFFTSMSSYVLYNYKLDHANMAQAERQRFLARSGSTYNALIEEYLEYFLPTAACMPFTGAWLLELAHQASQQATERASAIGSHVSVGSPMPNISKSQIAPAIASAAGFDVGLPQSQDSIARSRRAGIVGSPIASRSSELDNNMSTSNVLEKLIAGDVKLTELAAGYDLGAAVDRLLHSIAATPIVASHAASPTFVQILTENWFGQNASVVNPWGLPSPVIAPFSLVDAPDAREAFSIAVGELRAATQATCNLLDQALQNVTEHLNYPHASAIDTPAITSTQLAARLTRRAQAAVASYSRNMASQLGLSPQARMGLGLDVGVASHGASAGAGSIPGVTALFSPATGDANAGATKQSISMNITTALSPAGGAGPLLCGAARSIAAGLAALALVTSDELSAALAPPVNKTNPSDVSTQPLKDYVVGPHRQAAGSWTRTTLTAFMRDRLKWRDNHSLAHWAAAVSALHARVGAPYSPSFNPTMIHPSVLRDAQSSPVSMARCININFESLAAHVGAVVGGYVPDTDGDEGAAELETFNPTPNLSAQDSVSGFAPYEVSFAATSDRRSVPRSRARITTAESSSAPSSVSLLRRKALHLMDEGGQEPPLTLRLEHVRAMTSFVHAILSRPELHATVIQEAAADLLLAPTGKSFLYEPFSLAAEALTPSTNPTYKLAPKKKPGVAEKAPTDEVQVLGTSPAITGTGYGGLRGITDATVVARVAAPLVRATNQTSYHSSVPPATETQLIEAGVTASGILQEPKVATAGKSLQGSGQMPTSVHPATAAGTTNAAPLANLLGNWWSTSQVKVAKPLPAPAHLVHFMGGPALLTSVVAAAKRFEPACAPDRIIALAWALKQQYSSRSSLPPTSASVNALVAAVNASAISSQLSGGRARPSGALLTSISNPLGELFVGGAGTPSSTGGSGLASVAESSQLQFARALGSASTALPSPQNVRLNALAATAAAYNPQLAASDLVPPETILLQRHLYLTLNSAFGAITTVTRDVITSSSTPGFSFLPQGSTTAGLHQGGNLNDPASSALSMDGTLAMAGSKKWRWMQPGKWTSSFEAHAVSLMCMAKIGLDWIRPWQFAPTAPEYALERVKKANYAPTDIWGAIASQRAERALRRGLSIQKPGPDAASQLSVQDAVTAAQVTLGKMRAGRRNEQDSEGLQEESVWGPEIDSDTEQQYSSRNRPSEVTDQYDRIVLSSRRLARRVAFRLAAEDSILEGQSSASASVEGESDSSPLLDLELSSALHTASMCRSLTTDDEFARLQSVAQLRVEESLSQHFSRNGTAAANLDPAMKRAISAAAACAVNYIPHAVSEGTRLADVQDTLAESSNHVAIAHSITHGLSPMELKILSEATPESMVLSDHAPQARLLVSAASTAAVDAFMGSLPIPGAIAAARFAVARVSSAGFGLATLVAHKLAATVAKSAVAGSAGSQAPGLARERGGHNRHLAAHQPASGKLQRNRRAGAIPKHRSVPWAVLRDVMTQPSLGHPLLREDSIAVRYRGYILANLPFYSSLTLHAMTVVEGLLHDSLWHHPSARLPSMLVQEQSGTPPFLQFCLARAAASLVDCATPAEAVTKCVKWAESQYDTSKYGLVSMVQEMFFSSESSPLASFRSRKSNSSKSGKDSLAALRADILNISSKETDIFTLLEDFLELFNGPHYLVGNEVRRVITAAEHVLTSPARRALARLAPNQLGDCVAARAARRETLSGMAARAEGAALALVDINPDAAEAARALAVKLRKQYQDDDVFESMTDLRLAAIIARSRNRKDTPVFGFDITDALTTPYGAEYQRQLQESSTNAQPSGYNRDILQNDAYPRTRRPRTNASSGQAQESMASDLTRKVSPAATLLPDALGPPAILPFELVNEQMRARMGLGTAACASHAVGAALFSLGDSNQTLASGNLNFAPGQMTMGASSTIPGAFSSLPLPHPTSIGTPANFGPVAAPIGPKVEPGLGSSSDQVRDEDAVHPAFSSAEFLSEVIARITAAPASLYRPLIPPLPASVTLPLLQDCLENPGSGDILQTGLPRSTPSQDAASGGQTATKRFTRNARSDASSERTTASTRSGVQSNRLAVALAGSPLMHSTLRAASLRRLVYHVRTRRAKYLHTLRHCTEQLEKYLADIETLGKDLSPEARQKLRETATKQFVPAIPPFPPVCSANPEPEDSLCRKLTRIAHHMEIIFGLPDFNFAKEFPPNFVLVQSEDVKKRCLEASKSDVYAWSIAFGEGIGIPQAAIASAQLQIQTLQQQKCIGATSLSPSVLASVHILASVASTEDPFFLSDRVHVIPQPPQQDSRGELQVTPATKGRDTVAATRLIASDNHRAQVINNIIRNELSTNPWAGPVRSDEIEFLLRFWKRVATTIAPAYALGRLKLARSLQARGIRVKALEYGLPSRQHTPALQQASTRVDEMASGGSAAELTLEAHELLKNPPLPNLRILASTKFMAQVMFCVIVYALLLLMFKRQA